MKNMRRTRKIVTGIGFFCVYIMLGVSTVQGQFISREDRPRWDDRYESFSTYDIRKFPDTLLDRYGNATNNYLNEPKVFNPAWHGPTNPVTFDQFGNFLLPGGDVYNLTWDLSDVGTNEFYDSNRARIFQNLMISSDEFSNWQTQFMIGQNLRVNFTPSTLKQTNFRGFRWDGSNRKNSFSFIAKAGTQPGSEADRPRQPQHYRNMFGGHWQSVLGDVLTLGGTFVFENRGTQLYNNDDIAFGRYGLNDKDLERYMYVIITCDSPEDQNANAKVYDVVPVIDGKQENLPKRAFKIPNVIAQNQYSQGKFTQDYTFYNTGMTFLSARIPAQVEKFMYSDTSWFLDMMSSYNDASTALNEKDKRFEQFFRKGNPTGVIGYLNILDPNNPGDPTDRMFAADKSQGYLQASGTDVIIYEILIPARARQVEFLVNAANDYCIDIVAMLPNMQQSVTGGSFYDDPNGAAWGTGSWSVWYDAKHCVNAPGRVNDDSNADWVKVSYDRMTGVGVYGLNMEMNWRGIFVRGEINEYSAFRAYPIQVSFSGENQKVERSRAWFLNVERDFGKWAAGGEIFDYPFDYMEVWGEDLIDDNDDNNHQVGTAQRQYQATSGSVYNWEFPGLNYDHDGTPDWSHIDIRFTGEPYIGYYFDEVAYGDDFNHNGIIDIRENDDAIDLPYDRDSKGNHLFIKLKPSDNTMVTVGRYDITQEMAGGRNLTNYVKLEHYQRIGILEYSFNHRTERVKDNYKSNDYYWQYFGGPFTIGYSRISDVDNTWAGSYLMWQGRFNNLAYRDSWYNSTYLTTKFTLFRNLNIINNVKNDLISRVGDLTFEGSPQQQIMNAPRDIRTTAFVHKIDYTYRLANFRLMPDIYWHGMRLMKEMRVREITFLPQFKFTNYYLTGNTTLRDGNNHIYNYYPVLRFDYRIAPRTTFRCAFQGFPGLLEVYRNAERPIEEENRRRMFIGFETVTIYQGFSMLVTSGMRRDKRAFVEPMGRRLTGKTEYFITVQIEASR